MFGQTTFVDSIYRSIQHLPSAEQVDFLYTLAEKHANINLSEANQIAEKGLMLARSIKDNSKIIDGLLILGNQAIDQQELSYADSVLNHALDIANRTSNTEKIFKTKFALAKTKSQQGKKTEAIVHLNEILTIATEAGDSAIMAKAWLRLGLTYENHSDYEASLQAHYKALALHTAMNNKFNMGIVHTNIGMTLLRLQRNAEALDEFERAYQLSEQTDDTEGIMINTLNIGVANQRLGKFDQAKTAFRKSLEIAISLNSWYDIALLHANMGTTAMQQGNYKEAITFLERAIFIKDSIGAHHDLPHTVISLAEVYFLSGKYDLAIEKAMMAANLSREYHRLNHLSEAHLLLSKAFAATHNYSFAYDHLAQHKQISDSLFTTESDQAISDLKIRYETTLKETKIENLTAENERRKTTQLIYLGIALLILLTGASIVYAMYTRRTRDRIILAKEREMHDLQNRFFANISHEFRTPLTLILGPVHTLRQNLKGSTADSVLLRIQKNAERLLQLINQILDLAKFDQKVLELKREPFNLSLMMQGTIASFDSLAEDRDIRYSYDIKEHLHINADNRRLETVMVNLISNAFKFTPDHGSISIKADVDVAKQRYVIKVTDSGAGIPEENQSRIFDRYFHDDREAHADFEGAGIGLALSKHIVDMHGGSISIDSIVNVGSTFTVYLPFSLADHQSTPTSELVHPIKEESTIEELINDTAEVTGSKKKSIVLLVEDRKDMREYITSLLKQNYHVVEAPNADEGLTQAIHLVPDVIVSDVMMPGKSGFELCRELKTDMRTSHIPVMLLTAKSSTEDRISGLETEADVYLTKPFIPEELELHLRNLIASRRKINAFFTKHRRIEPTKMSFNSVDEKFLESLKTHLEAHYMEERFSVEDLASLMNLSRSQLHRKLNVLTGQAPNKLIRTFRMSRAKDMIESHSGSIAEIAYRVGFGSPAYFTKCFTEEYGHTPMEIMNPPVNQKPGLYP